MSSPPPAQHRCSTCQKAFSRLEHLQRHRKTHSGSRPFQCRHCSISFSRKDAVHRHEQSRHGTANHTERAPAMRRACLTCSTARVACSGETPCAYCRLKERHCVYVRRQRRSLSLAKDNASSTTGEEGTEDGSITVDAVPALGLTDTSVDYDQSFNVGSDSNPRSKNTSHPNETFWPQSPMVDHAPTPMNWLPFDLSTPDGYLDPPAGDNNSRLQQLISSADSMPGDINLTQHDGSASTPQLDSLNSLIASMGRASRAFSSSNHRPSVSFGEATGKPAGSLYSDGAGGRSSQAERAMHRQQVQAHKSNFAHQMDEQSPLNSEGSWLQTLEANFHSAPQSDDARLYQIPINIYGDIMAKVDSRIPFRSSSLASGLDSHNFPAKDTLEYFIGLYFERFQPVYPFLDLPLLNMPFWGWSLCLATASIGCYYSDLPAKDTCGDALSVILREILVNEVQFSRVECTLTYLQALLLNTLALCQSGNSGIMSLGEEAISSVMDSCRRSCLFEEPDWATERSIQFQGDVNQMWTAWRCREMRRRTGLFAWILDTSLAFTRTASPKLDLQSLNIMAPSKERLWEADSAQAWYKAHRPHTKEALDPIIFSAEEESRMLLSNIFTDINENLELVESASEFASVGCIYALLRRHWDLVRHFQAPLSIPHELCTHRKSHELTTASYPVAIPEFTRWRNKACDFMDVLHWDALGNSAKAGGWEGPNFLKLHLGRLILLTPVKELLTLAEQLVPGNFFVQLPHNVPWQRTDPGRCRQVASTWAHADRYKARLAVVHAGATFWHVRRYSTDSFVQPFTVYLAAVILFYFARLSVADKAESDTVPNISSDATRSYEGGEERNPLQLNTAYDRRSHSNTSHSPGEISIHSGGSSGAQQPQNVRMPSYYYVDRPVDDEMVQHFVRNGEATTRLRAEGIDDLCSADGAKMILLEAAALLESRNVVWPIARKYAMVLRAVAAAGENGTYA